MILVPAGYCAGCGEKLCERCTGCHTVGCIESVAVCRTLVAVHRNDRRVGRRGRPLTGAKRRLKIKKTGHA